MSENDGKTAVGKTRKEMRKEMRERAICAPMNVRQARDAEIYTRAHPGY